MIPATLAWDVPAQCSCQDATQTHVNSIVAGETAIVDPVHEGSVVSMPACHDLSSGVRSTYQETSPSLCSTGPLTERGHVSQFSVSA